MKNLWKTYLWGGKLQVWTSIAIFEILVHIIMNTIFKHWANPGWTFYFWIVTFIVILFFNVRSIRKEEFNTYYNLQKRYDKNLNKIVPYLCPSCNHITKTLQNDDGFIKDIIRCDHCADVAIKNETCQYNEDAYPTYEWYRPSFKIFKSIKNTKLKTNILNGYLLLKKIKY